LSRRATVSAAQSARADLEALLLTLGCGRGDWRLLGSAWLASEEEVVVVRVFRVRVHPGKEDEFERL
jgi:hypothetical protein